MLPAALHAVAASSPLRILAFGDSLTAGWTSFSSGNTPGFGPHLQKALANHHPKVKAEVHTAGAPGRPASQGLQPLQQELASGNIDVCLILLGANDLLPYFPVPPEHVVDGLIADLKAVHAAARHARSKTVALGLLDHPMVAGQAGGPAALKAINARIEREVGADAYIDGAALLSAGHRGAWSNDNIHLTPEGYAELGKHLSKSLAEFLLSQRSATEKTEF